MNISEWKFSICTIIFFIIFDILPCVIQHSICQTLHYSCSYCKKWISGSETNSLNKVSMCVAFLQEAAPLPHLWFSIEWRLLHERCALLGAKRQRPKKCLGGNYILVFLCYAASLIQYSQTHWSRQRAKSKHGHFLSLAPQTLQLQHFFPPLSSGCFLRQRQMRPKLQEIVWWVYDFILWMFLFEVLISLSRSLILGSIQWQSLQFVLTFKSMWWNI